MNEKLEDFGIKVDPTPQERLKTYQDQAMGLAPKVRAKFWLGVLDADAEVKKLVTKGGNPSKKKRLRSQKWENVGVHKEIGLVEENGVSQ
jgi:hypothetical protein